MYDDADLARFGSFTPGVLEVLSIGRGDLTLHVGTNDDDRDRARQLIEEMLRKGYAIFVETDDGPERVVAFNPSRMTYTIADGPDPEAAGAAPPDDAPTPPPPRKATKARKRTTEKPVAGSRATAVGRTAGG